MRRVRFQNGRILAVTVIFLIVLICFCYIFHKAPIRVSQQDTESQIYKRDYVLHQKLESLPKLDSNDRRGSQAVGELNIFAGRGTPPNGSRLASLKTLRGNTPIFVYPPEVDSIVSSRVRDYGTWEEDMLNATGTIFTKYPDLMFLDLGCNIGVYSLFIAKLGARVVSVDPVLDNLNLLSESLRLGNLATNVILVNNAISDNRRDAFVVIPNSNVGGAYISDDADTDENNNAIKTVVLDDLTPLLKGQKVFIKMDIEGHEHRALSSGKLFFQSVNVRGMLMEWVHHRYTENGEKIINILVTSGLLPYEDVKMEKPLNPDSSHRWPENVFWFKR